jgi:hypothetical protein
MEILIAVLIGIPLINLIHRVGDKWTDRMGFDNDYEEIP